MTTTDFAFAFEGADPSFSPFAHLQVVRFRGHEEISSLYSYELTLLAKSPAPEVDPHDLIGACATLCIAALTQSADAVGGEAERHLPGGVTSRWERDTPGRPQIHRVAQDDVQILGTGYQWRSEEQLAALIDTQLGPTRFQHDARSSLISAIGPPEGQVRVRALDAVGNVYRSPERRDRTK